ncbi:AraC family transcriptional regulator [Streptomyces sp. XM4193]|uniref:AraC family transcriptional regulator n=1 Tax=Streptomyces sp. XM4193 TaxID=2929782 RepID=UPI001FFA9C10|nr:AraC family transcriptional regulator [Streptomyces sp. XM4193]MCK1798240.1 AraC family transcriptional regulator [Streptomyces sp. XM4193]
MLERLNEALDHIEQRLDQPLDVRELSRIAMTSEYHFRRMFSALAGLPLSEYVRRRRLTVAGAEVLAGERTLLDVAVRYGYGSGEAFARAFRAVHGVGPGEARRTGAALQSQPRMSFRLIIEGSSSMRYRIVEKDAFRLVGRSARVRQVHEGLNPQIVAFLQGLGRETLDRIEALSDGEPTGAVAATVNFEDEQRHEGTGLDYHHCAVSSAPPPEDMTALDIPAGTWAVFECGGEFPATLQNMWRDVYTQWFPSNPYESRQGPSLVRVEESEDGETAESELWIPVERTTSAG